ncbi:hypothetical protein [Streptomyces axinellae]|uniref:Secreted protein n=1 Tax=Streptomyces axinellae TaxID=552788 RepID=A0ABN3Q442_9ACTN
MPRPNPAQIAYGSVTVICSSLAMLLLTQVRSGPGIVVIALAALALGLLVALTAPTARATLKRRRAVETAAAHRGALPAEQPARHIQSGRHTRPAQHIASAPSVPAAHAGAGARR